MKICFFGVGGVGGYFGAIVAEKFNTQHEIYFIARGKHKEVIQNNGITLKKSGGQETLNVAPKLCTDTINDIPVCDIIFLSVKGYDLEEAVKNIEKISDGNTIILPLLNGVDIYDRIRKNLKHSIVLPSCVYVGTHIESPGVIYQKGGSCKISIGKDPQQESIIPESLLKILYDSKIDFDWEDDVAISIWSKYMFICAFGLVTATYDKTLGQILENKTLSRLTQSIMTEIHAVAKVKSIALPDNIVLLSFEKANTFPYETKTSFQRDIEAKGKINEGDLFGGTIIRLGAEFGISVPNTETTYTKLVNKL